MKTRLLTHYQKKTVPEVKKKFDLKNDHAVPKVTKVVVNMGVGAAVTDIKILEKAVDDLRIITGQQPALRRAKKAVSNFKLREGIPVGCMVTLRRAKMYEFMDRLFNVALPRIRDFNGVSRHGFDKKGNYSLGIKDQAIFPEIELDRAHRTQGMDITFVFNHGPSDVTREVLQLLGMPFKER